MILDTVGREEWLEARRAYVTATDVARLAHGGPAMWSAIRAEKVDGPAARFSTPYTEWGIEREPHIIGLLTFLHDIDPNDRVYVLDGTVWAATPDGISPTMTAEVKTSVRGLGDDAESLRATPTGRKYFDQVQWAMLAADRPECAFAWELNDQFTPGPITDFIIPRDEDRIAELVEVAERFLAYCDEGEEATTGYDDLIAEYLAAKAIEDEAKARTAAVLDQIRERAGDQDVKVANAHASISYVLPKPRATFDAAAFKTAHPDLHKQFVKTTPAASRTLRITPKKD